MKLATETIGDERIDIAVDERGTFSADYNDQSYEAKTRGELIERLTLAVKKSKLQGTVDVTVLNVVPSNGKYNSGVYDKGVGFVNAKLRAKHERQHGTWLLVSVEGKKFNVGSYSGQGTICRRLTPEESTRYMQLATAVTEAEAALSTFIEAARVNPAEALAGATLKGGK